MPIQQAPAQGKEEIPAGDASPTDGADRAGTGPNCAGISRSVRSAWTPESYARHNYRTFADFAPAGEVLSAAHVDYPLLHAALFYATNEQRAKHNATQLAYSPALEKAAREHSIDMVAHGFFAHENPNDAAKRTVTMRLALQGIPAGAQAENIARYTARRRSSPYTYLSYARLVVGNWIKSSGHRANILDPSYRSLGCGASDCGKTCFHIAVTQDFADVAPDAVPTLPLTAPRQNTP